MNPTIAVLIPTKNRRIVLERALKSVFSQIVQPEEIIVVNDGSTDDTKVFLDELSKNIPKLKVVHREKSGGVNSARNLGTKAAKSDWIAWLDDDDEFTSEAVKIMKEKISSVPNDFDVVYFNTRICTDEGSSIGGFQFDNLKKKLDFYDPAYEETMTKFNLKKDCKQVMRKSLIIERGYLFPETVNGFESYFFSLIARDGIKIRYYPEILTLIHQESFLKDRLSINAPRKNPWPMFVLHFKQLFQHWKFYLLHPNFLIKKKVTMIKLLLLSLFR